MRILLVSQYFAPEVGAPQARLSELAELWVEAGDEVTVLTGMPNHPNGVVPHEYRGRIRMTEWMDGYRVVRTWLYATPNEGVARKTLSHLSFMFSALLLGWRVTGPADVVLVSSPTFFQILSAWVLAKVKRARFVVEVRDLWPAIFVELGVLTNRQMIAILERLELAAYRAADAVVTVTEGFRDDIVRRGIEADKVHVVHNGVDIDRFRPWTGDTSTARRWMGAHQGDVLVIYIGAHGISHALPRVAEAAAKLAGEPIHIAFVGDGAAKRDLHGRVRELRLDNVTMLPSVPRDDVAELVGAADICLVPLRDVPLFRTFIPSKMFEFLAAEKAVVGSVRGEPAEILHEAGAVVVEPEDAAGLADAIRELASTPSRREAMGQAGRKFVAAQFNRRDLARLYRAILASVTGATS